MAGGKWYDQLPPETRKYEVMREELLANEYPADGSTQDQIAWMESMAQVRYFDFERNETRGDYEASQRALRDSVDLYGHAGRLRGWRGR